MKPGLVAFVAAVVGAIVMVAAIPLQAVGLAQMYELHRNQDWLNGQGGMPPAAAIAGTVLGSVGVLLLLIAVALAIYSKRPEQYW
jgi:cation transporter-like permease